MTVQAEHLTGHVSQLLKLCRDKSIMLRTAESCTAGAIAATIASVSGASDVLDRGWIVYSNQAKHQELGIDKSLIEAHGAVSQQVVEAMARGGSASGIACVAVSGIAGPSGGTQDKPVGTVWIAVALGRHICASRCCHFDGDRLQVQLATVFESIRMLIECVEARF